MSFQSTGRLRAGCGRAAPPSPSWASTSKKIYYSSFPSATQCNAAALATLMHTYQHVLYLSLVAGGHILPEYGAVAQPGRAAPAGAAVGSSKILLFAVLLSHAVRPPQLLAS